MLIVSRLTLARCWPSRPWPCPGAGGLARTGPHCSSRLMSVSAAAAQHSAHTRRCQPCCG